MSIEVKLFLFCAIDQFFVLVKNSGNRTNETLIFQTLSLDVLLDHVQIKPTAVPVMTLYIFLSSLTLGFHHTD